MEVTKLHLHSNRQIHHQRNMQFGLNRCSSNPHFISIHFRCAFIGRYMLVFCSSSVALQRVILLLLFLPLLRFARCTENMQVCGFKRCVPHVAQLLFLLCFFYSPLAAGALSTSPLKGFCVCELLSVLLGKLAVRGQS